MSNTATQDELPEHVARYGGHSGTISFHEPREDVKFRRTATKSSISSGSSRLCDYAYQHQMLCWKDIFQPPILRQYIQGGRLYREREAREPDKFELFFDLVLVGVVHQLAESAGEGHGGATIAKIVLTFYPAWSIWQDTRNWLNQSGVDDVFQRIQTLATLICLVGYSANATAIQVGAEDAEHAASLVHRLLRRAVEAATGEVVSGENVEDLLQHGPQRAVVAATAFFLVAKLLRIVTYLGYAVYLSDFRASYLFRSAGLAAVSLVFVGCCFAQNIVHVAIIAACGIALDIMIRFSIGIVAHIERQKHARGAAAHVAAGLQPDTFVNITGRMLPAFNLEHLVERSAAFVSVVLGESVVSLLFVARSGSIGLSDEYLRAVFGLTIAFVANALYFDAALSRKFLHAVRRHWFTHIIWDIIHFPLCAALILASAALQKMVVNQEVSQAIRWQYGGSMGVALFCITCIGLVHQSLDDAGVSHLGQTARAGLRSVVGLIAILLPLVKDISSTAFLGAYVAILGAMMLVEIWAKLGREEREAQVDTTKVDDELEEEREEERERRDARARQEGDVAGDRMVPTVSRTKPDRIAEADSMSESSADKTRL